MPANPHPGSAPCVCASCSSACSTHCVLLSGPRRLCLGLALLWADPSPRGNCTFSFPCLILPAMGKQTKTSISTASSSAQEAVKGLGQRWSVGEDSPLPRNAESQAAGGQSAQTNHL